VAQQAFKISDEYTAPRGTLIIPDIVSACRQGYSDPHTFDPERFR
jgi:cytochrome P450